MDYGPYNLVVGDELIVTVDRPSKITVTTHDQGEQTATMRLQVRGIEELREEVRKLRHERWQMERQIEDLLDETRVRDGIA